MEIIINVVLQYCKCLFIKITLNKGHEKFKSSSCGKFFFNLYVSSTVCVILKWIVDVEEAMLTMESVFYC